MSALKEIYYKYKTNDFDRELIRNVIHKLYAQKKTLPTAIMIILLLY